MTTYFLTHELTLVAVKGISMAHWLQRMTVNLQVVGLNPAHACICGICFIRKMPYVLDVITAKAKQLN